MIDAPQIFLSYRRIDSAYITGQIYKGLVQQFGHAAVFRDINDIRLGTNFRQRIDQMLSQCKVMLVVIGPEWVKITDDAGKRRLDDPGDLVRVEVESALERNIPVVPLLVGGATVPKKEELPGRLIDIAERHGLFIRPDPDFDNDLERLIREVQGYLPDIERPLTTAATPSLSPAVGENSIEQYISKAADPKFISRVMIAEFFCIASVLLSIWVAGTYLVPLTASLDQIILYALGCSLIIALLLGLSNWWMRYDESWISTLGGTIMLVIIWAFVAILF